MNPGQRLGMYRLVERLGRGGFAEVWRARPEPATAFGPDPSPETLVAGTRALAALLRGAPASAGQAPGVLAGLAEQQERLVKPGVPAGLLAAEAEAARVAFRWVEELAAGGDLDVAVKVPFHDGWVRQLRREKDVLRRVEHPRLVRQLELDVAHEPPFLAMELVRGWSLRDALKSEPRPPVAKVLAIMDQLLTVLDHLHKRGVVHGDVKPENILLEPDGALRLIDLGLGQVSQAVLRDAYLSLSLASRVPILGTLSYMAPEVRKGLAAGPASDLYSAGIVLYEMLVGDVPHGMTLPSEAVPERELSPRFDVLLKWVLHPDPARRVPSARELRERILVTLRERPRHQYGSGRGGVAREGTHAFDEWALGAASPFVAGDWVGPWQLEAPLGRGGFGEVWRARRGPGDLPALRADGAPTGPDTVALKIALGPHGRDGLQREAEVARRLSHPRIPAVRDAALAHDPPYLVVDFAAGRSLRARLVEDGPLEPAELVPALASLVSALVHCHAAGVVHRDLKPENLLLDEEHGTLTLLDFGLATCPELEERQRVEVSRSLESKPGQDPGGGTFEYMAPERKRGAPGAPPADAYALGVIVFELLTGELPRGLTRLRELRPLTPPWLEALVAKLLDPAPDARPSLLQVQARLGSEATPTRQRLSLGRRGLQAVERQRGALLWAGLGAILLTLVLVVHAHQQRVAARSAAAEAASLATAREEEAPPPRVVPTDPAEREALRRDVLRAPAATGAELEALVERLQRAAVRAAIEVGSAPGPTTRRLDQALELRARRSGAEAALAEAEQDASLARAYALGIGQGELGPGDPLAEGLSRALEAGRRGEAALARATSLDPDGPGAGRAAAARLQLRRDADGWSRARLERATFGLGLSWRGGAARRLDVEAFLLDEPQRAVAALQAQPEFVRQVLAASAPLAARAEAAAERGDVEGVAAIASGAARAWLEPSAVARVDAAVLRAQDRRAGAEALVARATAPATPAAEQVRLLELAGRLCPATLEAREPRLALAHARAAAARAEVRSGEHRRRARAALWSPGPDGPALALALAGDDRLLEAVAHALLDEPGAAESTARQAGGERLVPLIQALAGEQQAVAACEARLGAATAKEHPAALLAAARARVERELARQALRDAADPLP